MALKRIVVIGGGTGTFTVLKGLRDYPFQISAIISTADDGGSTGILRDELGVLPPGDLRQALVALSADSPVLRDLFNYRFEEGSLKGHNFGNLLLSALEKITGRFDKAIIEAGKILAIKGRVIPVTTDQMRLKAATIHGQEVSGEHAIEEHIWSELPEVDKLWLEPPCTVHPLAKQAIIQADLVVIAPGSVFTSLIPNLLVSGVTEALKKTRAKIVYVANLMTEKGQADTFAVQDFVDLLESYMDGQTIDYVLYNTRVPEADRLERYKKEMERLPVRVDRSRRKSLHYQLVGTNLLSAKLPFKPNESDALAKTRTLIRHDSQKLARAINALIFLKEAQKYLK